MAKAYAKRSFHFDSWRLNTISIVFTPAYVYTEESDPHDPSHHTLWFKAQTRVWGYDLANAGDHKEYAKPLTDNVGTADPNRQETSQNLNPELTLGGNTYSPDDKVVERLQVSGLMAPDGNVDRILETVVNNILVTNDLDIPAVRCRVLLTTPLESFVMGRTIVLSRGLIDVLPDEATLAAVLSHELAHIVLNHSTGEKFLSGLTLPFPDSGNLFASGFSFRAGGRSGCRQKSYRVIWKVSLQRQACSCRTIPGSAGRALLPVAESPAWPLEQRLREQPSRWDDGAGEDAEATSDGPGESNGGTTARVTHCP